MAKRSNGLFTKLDAPLAGTAMGSCYVYHTAGPGVDLGVQIFMEGSLFLSNTAIREAAEVAGMVVNEEGIQLEADLAHALRKIEKLEAENADLREQLDAVGTAVANAVRKS
jgi:hypothetical protein